MKLLVAGAAAVDAGKTTFSTGLCEEIDATGYKPRAGNDYWYDHDDYRRAVDDGRLYGKDAKRLAAASPADVAPEAVNPVHRLWLPTPGRGTGILGREGRAFAADRVTTDAGDRFVTNATVELPSSAREALPLRDALAVDDLPAFNEVMAELHRPAMARVADRIREADRAVVESYADVARPLQDLAVDAVAVVEPRRCRVYDGDRYGKACEVASGSATEGRLEERVGDVVDLLDPVVTVELPALGADERTDPPAVAAAYGHAYDALVAAALE